MKKEQFMEELKESLSGQVSPQTYYDTINYYEDFFKKEKEAGKKEEDIVTGLGSGRLIAKTIIESEGRKTGSQSYYEMPDEKKHNKKENRQDKDGASYQKGWHVNVDEEGKTSMAFGRLDFSSVLGKIVLIVLAVIVLALVIGVIWLGLKIIFYIIIPVVLILLIVNIIMSFVDGGRR